MDDARSALFDNGARLVVTKKREFSAHNFLISSAFFNVREAEASAVGSFHHQLAAIVLSGLALEALCNAIGDRVIERWKDFETGNPIAKLRVLVQSLGVDYDAEVEPWSSAVWLYSYRNKIAHAKPCMLESEIAFASHEAADAHVKEMPMSDLERFITLGNAKRALSGVERVRDLFCGHIEFSKTFGLHSDGWSYSTKLEQST